METLKHRFMDYFLRDEAKSDPLMKVLSVEDVRSIANAVTQNAEAYMAYHANLYSRCAADWRPSRFGEFLYGTSPTLHKASAFASYHDDSVVDFLHFRLEKVMAENQARFASNQLTMKEMSDSLAQGKYYRMFEELTRETAKSMASAEASSFIRDLDKAAYSAQELDQKRRDFELQSYSQNLEMLIQEKLDEVNAEYQQVSKEALGDLHGKSWFEILRESFEKDLLPAFNTYCMDSHRDLHMRVSKGIDQILNPSKSPSMSI